jgi:hypothetical protein
VIIIAKAIRDYGMIVVDHGGQATVQLEDIHSAGTAWNDLGIGGIWTFLMGLVTQSRLYALAPPG